MMGSSTVVNRAYWGAVNPIPLNLTIPSLARTAKFPYQNQHHWLSWPSVGPVSICSGDADRSNFPRHCVSQLGGLSGSPSLCTGLPVTVPAAAEDFHL